MRARRTILAAAAVLAALPAAAPAATVSARHEPGRFIEKSGQAPGRELLAYVAEPGEANRLVIRLESGGAVSVVDPGAPLRAEGHCSARSEHEVVCPAPNEVRAEMGDGDDTATAEAPSLLYGGPGDDTLSAGPGADTLSGGPGRDILHGGAGGDWLTDDDQLALTDVYDGGPGDDALSYRGRTDPISVDLADGAPDGAPGEGDRVAGVEAVFGGAGDDRLAGAGGPDRLDGGGGADTLVGRGGDDQLDGGGGDTAGERVDAGPGDDSVSGGSGRDTLDLGTGDDFADPGTGPDEIDAGAGDDRVILGSAGHRRSRLRCGPGTDKLDFAPLDLPPTLGDDCELVLPDGDFDRTGERLRLTPRIGSVDAAPARFRVARFLPSEPGREYLRLELRLVEAARRRSRERVIGAAQQSWRRGRRIRFAVPLRASGRRLLAARGRLEVRLVADRRRGGPRAGRRGVRFTLRLRR